MKPRPSSRRSISRRPAAGRLKHVTDRYRVLSNVGGGASADVFRVRDALFQRVVALKRFRSRAGEELKRTLASEFVLLAGLRHPVLPRVYDFAVDAEDRPFFTMDYLEGPSLEDLLVRCRGARDSERTVIVARYAGRTLSALSYIHARGVVHGDIKPSNILFARKSRGIPGAGDLRLVDFGLSFAVDAIAAATPRGTPRYMAPEVRRGAPPDAQSDLYSLGAVLQACRDTRRADSPASSPFASRLEAFISRLVEPSRSLRYRRAEEAFGDLAALLETRDAAAARELRMSFSFALRPRAWASGETRLRERIAETRAGAGGVVVAEGLRGEPARRILTELAARARASRMRVEILVADGVGSRSRIREMIARTLEAHKSLASRAHPARGNAGSPGSALALRMGEAGRGADAAGAAWLIESASPLDGADVETLAHLSFGLRESPALVLVACPAIVGDAEHPSLAARDVASFPRLEEGDVDLALADLFGEIQPRVSLTRVLHDASGGDAADLERAIESAVGAGALTRARGGWTGDPTRVRRAAREATSKARQAVLVPPALAGAARYLAILGAEFDTRAASAVLGDDSQELSRVLSGLRLAGCIAETCSGDPGRRWRFATPGLADSLAAVLVPAKRRLLHRRALAHFRAANGDGQDKEALAKHLEGSGDCAGAAAIHLDLGRTAFEAHDFMGACEHLEQALGPIVTGAADGAGSIRFELAKALQSGGRIEASRAHLQRLIDEPGGVDPVDVRISQAWNLNELGRRDEGLALLDAALSRVPQDDRSRRGLIHAQKSWIEYVRKDFEKAERHLHAAREATGGEAEPRVLASIESLSGRLQAARGNGSAAEAPILRAAEIYRRSRDGWRLHTELHTLGLILVRKEPERAKEYFLGAREECARVGDDRGLSNVLGHLASVDRVLGNWDAAAAEYRLAIDLGESLAVAGLNADYMNLGTLLTDQGAFEEAEACFLRASHLAGVEHAQLAARFVQLNRARLELRRGNSEAALELLDTVAPALSSTHIPTWINHFLYRAQALAELGRFADAEVSARAAATAAAAQEDETFQGEALLYGAVVDRLSGRRDSAIEKLDQAKTIFVRNNQRQYEARALLERGESLAGEVERADEALADVNAAVEMFERFGAAPFLDRAIKLRERLARESRRRKEAPRELETLYRVGRFLEVVEDMPALLEDLLDASIELVGAERGMIFLVAEGDPKELVRAASRSLDDSEVRDAEKTSRGILKRALADDSPLLSHDAKSDPRLRSLKSVIRFNVRSVLCAPLRTAKTVLGTIYLDHRTPGRFGEKEAEFMRALAGLAAPAIAAAAARRRLDTEVRGLRQAVRSLRMRDRGDAGRESIVGSSGAMQRVRDLVERCAAGRANVLIVGETGTGKDLVAKAIHEASSRAGSPFIAVGGADLQGDMSNADLFGAAEGAATGVHARPGKFELASGGTLYFHAMESLPLDTQARLLRVLEEPYVERVGGTTKIPIDVRFLCATSADLAALVEAGGFRRDLYFRLNVVSIEIPPLRVRREDIEPLVRHFLALSSLERGVPVLAVSSHTLRTWQAYSWPGNARQLRGLIERAVVLGNTELPPVSDLIGGAGAESGANLVDDSAGRSESLDAWTARYIRRVFERCGGQKKLACAVLKINYRTLQRYLRMPLPEECPPS